MSAAYLDHAAASPLDPRVREAMLPFLGRPSAARRACTSGGGRPPRRSSAPAPRWPPWSAPRTTWVIFTAGAVEARNLAVKGLLRGNRALGRGVVASAVEHPATLAACRTAERGGASLDLVAGGRGGPRLPRRPRRRDRRRDRAGRGRARPAGHRHAAGRPGAGRRGARRTPRGARRVVRTSDDVWSWMSELAVRHRDRHAPLSDRRGETAGRTWPPRPPRSRVDEALSRSAVGQADENVHQCSTAPRHDARGPGECGAEPLRREGRASTAPAVRHQVPCAPARQPPRARRRLGGRPPPIVQARRLAEGVPDERAAWPRAARVERSEAAAWSRVRSARVPFGQSAGRRGGQALPGGGVLARRRRRQACAGTGSRAASRSSAPRRPRIASRGKPNRPPVPSEPRCRSRTRAAPGGTRALDARRRSISQANGLDVADKVSGRPQSCSAARASWSLQDVSPQPGGAGWRGTSARGGRILRREPIR